MYKVYIYPILFGLFVPLSIYAEHAGEIDLAELVVPFSLIAGFSIAILGIARALGRNMDRTAIFLSLFWLLFFQSGRFNQLGANLGVSKTVVLSVAIAGGIAALYLVWRLRPTALAAVSTWLFLTALIFTAPPAWLASEGVFEGLAVDAKLRVDKELSATKLDTTALPASHTRFESRDAPDIFFVILDGYGGEETLSRYFAFDNTPFYQSLEQRGFALSRASHSNYSKTLFSLASILNMSYLDVLTADYGEEFTNSKPLRHYIANARVFEVLNREGYAIHLMASSSHLVPRGEIGRFDTADSYMTDGQYALAVVGNTPLRKLFHADRFFLEFDVDMKPWVPESLDWTFERALGFADNGEKDFVLVHILSPHSPYYFDEKCQLVPEYQEQHWNNFDGEFELYRRAYVKQLLCVNQKVDGFLAGLETRSVHSPIVILQADHGPPEIMDSVLQREGMDSFLFRTGILNAFLVPEAIRGDIHDGMTSVNTFRWLLTHLTGAQFELLENRSYRADYRQPYLFRQFGSGADTPPDDPSSAASPQQ